MQPYEMLYAALGMPEDRGNKSCILCASGSGWICAVHAPADSSSPAMTHVDGVPPNI